MEDLTPRQAAEETKQVASPSAGSAPAESIAAFGRAHPQLLEAISKPETPTHQREVVNGSYMVQSLVNECVAITKGNAGPECKFHGLERNN